MYMPAMLGRTQAREALSSPSKKRGGVMPPSGLQEGLRGLQPRDVLALLLVEGRSIDEVAHLVAHADLCQVLVQGLLKLVVQILKLWAVVASDAVLLLCVGEGLHVADDIPMVLAGLRAAEERDPGAARLALDGHAEVRGLLVDGLLALLVRLWIEGASELPLDVHSPIADLLLEHHVHIA